METAKEKKNEKNKAQYKDNPTNKNGNTKRRNSKSKQIFWITRDIAEDYGREELLGTILIETIVYAVFITIVTIYAMGVHSSTWFYLTKGLKDQFVEREFQTLNDADISFENIRTTADFWFYIENHMIGSFFWESTYTEEYNLPYINENSMNILYENRVLGVPRIRQVKVTNDSCTIHEYFRRLFLDCYDAYSGRAEDKQSFGLKIGTPWTYSDATVTKSLSHWGKISTYGGGGFYTDLTNQKNSTLEIIQTLKENLWITRGTRAVFVDFSVYNANLNIFAICKMIFEFPTTGGVIPSTEFHSLSLIRLHKTFDWFILICECCIYGFILFYALEDIREFHYFKISYFAKFWSYIDMAIIIGFIANAGISCALMLEVPSAIDTIKKNPNKYGNLEYLGYLQIQNNNLLAVNLFLVYVKLFKFLNFSKTMGQLNNTLKKCAMDILGFSIMFFIIFFAFAELGYLLFGSKVENFSSFGISMFTLLRTILGDFDYNEIEQANRILAPIYFLSYIFLVFFVLLNMFLAIINDTYADVKTEIAISPDEMQMTEYVRKSFYNVLRKFGCGSSRLSETSDVKKGLNVTIRQIREALKKCGFSDLEIEMFFARYNIDPLAEVETNVETLLSELEEILDEESGREKVHEGYVHINDFVTISPEISMISPDFLEISPDFLEIYPDFLGVLSDFYIFPQNIRGSYQCSQISLRN